MAQQLQNGKQQFIDGNGNPVAGGSVFYYLPGTLTLVNTYSDQTLTTPNANPVVLDAEGRASVWGSDGTYYRQIVKDALGNTIWDEVVGSLYGDASYLNYTEGAAGSTKRTIASKFQESISVLDFGSDPTGGVDSTTSFSNAAKAIASSAGYSDITGISVAPVVKVKVPAPGAYTIGSLVDVGNFDVIWEIEEGASISNYNNLNGRVSISSKRISSGTYGIFDYATAFGVRANPSDLGQGSQVLGLASPGELSSYPGRDSVAFFSDNYGPAPIDTQSTASYSDTTATLGAALTNAQMSALRVGMIIDTLHTPKWSGFLTSWTSTSITVSGWYQSGGTSGTPANGTGLVISPITKIWAQNANATLDGASYATSATGFELGTLNNKASTASPGGDPAMWGFDSVSLGTYKADYAYIARGSWFGGFFSNGQDTGFFYRGSSIPFAAQDASQNTVFSMSATGNLEIGSQGTAQRTYLDLHSSGTANDFDARIYCDGGSATAGQGTWGVNAALANFSCDIRPVTDNTNALGGLSNRFTAVYAVNGTIQTSDPSLKTDISDLPESLGLVRHLSPKTFKWKVGGHEATWVEEEQEVQETKLVEHEINEPVVEDGKAILRKKIILREVPVFDEYPVFDDHGEAVYDTVKTQNGLVIRKQRVHKVPRMVKQLVKVQKHIEREGKRTHWGFLATDVRDVFANTGRDFAGYVLGEDGTHHLRPDQLIPVLWKAVQELSDQLDELKSQSKK